MIIKDLLIKFPVEPKRQSKRWPAIVLTVRQIARVRGRINNLIDSIITINSIRFIKKFVKMIIKTVISRIINI